ncbi:MAG: MAPEG family protein [Alphaproteobacteria bacterium]|nr:MAPEG family protein [Alphaproteobacteria bacterium]MBV9370616.1 MAPEG family protein [Alphaproteobacteria bacterium]MBV9900170.1 MAPEG family protein [Alphaproteobacteria bacterium]
MHSPILAPVVALVAWSLVMMTWMYAVRFPAMARKGISLKGRVGSKGGDLDGVVEPSVQWKAHNFNHLMEQPTLFYAVALSLALMGVGGGWNLWLGWAYVAFRIAHSLVQATVNVVRWRFLLFLGGSLCLAALTLHAGMALLGMHVHG